MTAEPVRGYSGTVHFGVPDHCTLRVSRVQANSYGDKRQFVTVGFKGYDGMEFIFDRADVPEGWKEEPDLAVLYDEAVAAVCKRMHPRALGDIFSTFKRAMVDAKREGEEEVKGEFRQLLGIR